MRPYVLTIGIVQHGVSTLGDTILTTIPEEEGEREKVGNARRGGGGEANLPQDVRGRPLGGIYTTTAVVGFNLGIQRHQETPIAPVRDHCQTLVQSTQIK